MHKIVTIMQQKKVELTLIVWNGYFQQIFQVYKTAFILRYATIYFWNFIL